MAEMKLRGHHLLCVLGYRGFGYSPQHISKMWEVKDRLWACPDTVVEVVAGPDGVCYCCPHLQQGHCAVREGAEVWVRRHERQVMQRLGLKDGARLAWSQMLERLRAAFTPEVLARLCAGCRWFPAGYCVEGLMKVRAGDV